MLADLRIENLALVEETRASFSPGLNVISGETGAGKSILLQALTLTTGGRASSEFVRAGAERGVVEARFELRGDTLQRVSEQLSALGLPRAEAGLIVRRVLERDGKSRVYINDASATVRSLEEVTAGLVDFTGQHDQVSLLSSERQVHLLDSFATADALVATTSAAVQALRQLEAEQRSLREQLAARTEREEFLRYYLKEFQDLAPEKGEDLRLQDEADRLRHADKHRQALASAADRLYEGPANAHDLIGDALEAVTDLADGDPELTTACQQLEQARDLVEAAARAAAFAAERADSDPARADEIEARLLRIQRMCRKHRCDLDELIDKMDDAARELAALAEIERRLGTLGGEIEQAKRGALSAARSLSAKRREAAPALAALASSHLRDLKFQGAEFRILVTSHEDPDQLGPLGADRVSFELSANPGMPPRPLSKVASGGELSRILLALKCALSEVDSVPVHVFDEVDTGLGGAAAEILGRKIRQLADRAQVFCVTHLAQIASFADGHSLVSKRVEEGATRTLLSALDGPGREAEIARMLGGEEITQATREHAREMLTRAVAGAGGHP